MSFVYLASPYSHVSAHVRGNRFGMVCQKAANLMMQGYAVFSPIAHSHAVAANLDEEYVVHHEFWMKQDLPLLEAAQKVVVLTLDGWAESKGVTAEIAHAKALGIPVEYHDMSGIVFVEHD